MLAVTHFLYKDMLFPSVLYPGESLMGMFWLFGTISE